MSETGTTATIIGTVVIADSPLVARLRRILTYKDARTDKSYRQLLEQADDLGSGQKRVVLASDLEEIIALLSAPTPGEEQA